MAGRAPVTARIVDISRGGLQLFHECDAAIGSDAQVVLADGAAIGCRIARSGRQLPGLAFRQDTASLAVIDRARHGFGAAATKRRAA